MKVKIQITDHDVNVVDALVGAYDGTNLDDVIMGAYLLGCANTLDATSRCILDVTDGTDDMSMVNDRGYRAYDLVRRIKDDICADDE